MKNRPQAATIDGHPRSAEIEDALNRACFEAMKTPEGKQVHDWLKSITTSYVLGSGHEPTEYVFQEGMRFAVALIDARIEAHKATLNGSRQ